MARERRVRFRRLVVGVLGCCLLPAAGCGKPEPPPRVSVGGLVTIDGKPVPSASVTFYPLFEGFGGELIAEGVTDTAGRYTLACPLGDGACIGNYKVTVSDAPTPDDAREQSVEAQRKMQAFLRSLTNRPIGVSFGTLATTPLEVEVVAESGDYDLHLTH
jgi:5-hydroxyisourate hydrolase-like protein (transthyretin family)